MSGGCCPSPQDTPKSCESKTAASGSGDHACFLCGKNGKRVGRETVQALANPDSVARLGSADGFFFCATSDCEVVYFNGDGTAVRTGEMRAPVFQKDAGSDVPVCYCFNHTRRSIAAEIARTGKSTVLDDIKQKVKAGLCACETTNPQGTCCLGNVGQAVRAALERLSTAKGAMTS
ncbi:copper chaperone Copz family protein [bacterium]|nr:copper chaperone Copz family protein [bacterium]